jgi:hypothetical protein
MKTNVNTLPATLRKKYQLSEHIKLYYVILCLLAAMENGEQTR